jgi:hypothetical protein
MSTITVTWKAFNNNDPKRLQDFADAGRKPVTSRTIEVESANGVNHDIICEHLFRDTNLYQGSWWTLLQPLPEDRTHTALSVGDEVTIDGQVYRCEDIGFSKIGEMVECPNHEGAFDCTPFCRLCEGEQEMFSSLLDTDKVNM